MIDLDITELFEDFQKGLKFSIQMGKGELKL